MRKLIVVIATLTILMLALTGCGRRLNTQNEPPTQQTGNTTNQQAKSNESTARTPASSGQADGGSAIIAKSGNIVSSSDKAELLNQVDKELDSLVNSTNNLDDVQDSDLNVNQ